MNKGIKEGKGNETKREIGGVNKDTISNFQEVGSKGKRSPFKGKGGNAAGTGIVRMENIEKKERGLATRTIKGIWGGEIVPGLI